jgi:transcriptional regulator with GAF, ATPase, and Fis domain
MRRATYDLHALATLVTGPADLDEVLSRALQALRRVIPYDLAAVLRKDGDRLRVAVAEGPLATPAVRAHELDLRRFPTIRRALAERRPIPLEEHHHDSAEGDPYDGVLDLPHGHSCMVVPLFAGDEELGIITLDRTTCAIYPDTDVQLAGIYGQLVSMAIRFADQARALDGYRRRLEEGRRLLVEDAGGGAEAARRLSASRSAAMRALVEQARRLATADLPVLIQGETGVGKELLAHALHAWSPRAGGTFLAVNCAALPEQLAESELFGHVKGAFSGAVRDRPGRFVAASGGTLFLDEVGELPLALQAKLLRVLQDGAVTPVGADRPVPVDVRIVSASHVDLSHAVQEGCFREDLYYRLAVVPLHMPPLRERPEDVEDIAQGLLEGLARAGRGPWTLPADTLDALVAHRWPGNVRELRNAVERASVLTPSGPLSPADLGLSAAPATARLVEDGPVPSYAAQETAYFRRLLEATAGKIYGEDGAAALAGLKPTTLHSKLKKRGLR